MRILNNNICQKWQDLKTEDVVILQTIFSGKSPQIVIKAIIDEINEELTLQQFGYVGWVVPKEKGERIATDGIFTILEEMKSERVGGVRKVDANPDEIFEFTKTVYDNDNLILKEIQDKAQLSDFIFDNLLNNPDSRSEKGSNLMIRVLPV